MAKHLLKVVRNYDGLYLIPQLNAVCGGAKAPDYLGE